MQFYELNKKPKTMVYTNKLGQKVKVKVLGWAGEDWPKNVIRVIFPDNQEYNVFKHQLS